MGIKKNRNVINSSVYLYVAVTLYMHKMKKMQGKTRINHLSVPDHPVVQVVLTESILIAVSICVDRKTLVDCFFCDDDSTR